MRDTELYAQILGVQSPWNVDCVDFLKDKKSDGNDLLKGTKYDWLRNGNTKRKHGQRRHGAIFLAGCVEAGYHQWLILQNHLKNIFMES